MCNVQPSTRRAFQQRFQLNPLNGKAGSGSLVGSLWRFWGTEPFPLPLAGLPVFRSSLRQPLLPTLIQEPPPRLSYTRFLDVPLLGNWWVFVAVLLLLVVNILGEELWWRGYILPRQELSQGKGAWVAHGLLWTLFHVVFYPWALLSYLPVCLTIPCIAQRLKNTWPGIILHFVINGVVLIPITLGILGVHG